MSTANEMYAIAHKTANTSTTRGLLDLPTPRIDRPRCKCLTVSLASLASLVSLCFAILANLTVKMSYITLPGLTTGAQIYSLARDMDRVDLN